MDTGLSILHLAEASILSETDLQAFQGPERSFPNSSYNRRILMHDCDRKEAIKSRALLLYDSTPFPLNQDRKHLAYEVLWTSSPRSPGHHGQWSMSLQIKNIWRAKGFPALF